MLIPLGSCFFFSNSPRGPLGISQRVMHALPDIYVLMTKWQANRSRCDTFVSQKGVDGM